MVIKKAAAQGQNKNIVLSAAACSVMHIVRHSERSEESRTNPSLNPSIPQSFSPYI
jgi:hypothetical protein